MFILIFEVCSIFIYFKSVPHCVWGICQVVSYGLHSSIYPWINFETLRYDFEQTHNSVCNLYQRLFTIGLSTTRLLTPGLFITRHFTSAFFTPDCLSPYHSPPDFSATSKLFASWINYSRLLTSDAFLFFQRLRSFENS